MARIDREVKSGRWRQFLDWIDGHPRSGWYVAAIVTANFVLQLIDLLLRALGAG